MGLPNTACLRADGDKVYCDVSNSQGTLVRSFEVAASKSRTPAVKKKATAASKGKK
jgi:hypothetical protein